VDLFAEVADILRSCSVFLPSLSRRKGNPIISDSVVDTKVIGQPERERDGNALEGKGGET
jgi:hypothetical protein